MIKQVSFCGSIGLGASSADYAQSGSTKTGWSAIQDHLLDHDGDMMNDFAEDIDTLLVFVSHRINLRYHFSDDFSVIGWPVLRRTHGVRHLHLPRS